MPFDMRRETPRHQAGWRAFVTFLMLSSLGIIVVLGILALTLL